VIHIRKGLRLPLAGEPEQRVHDGPSVDRVALLGPDYHGLRPAMAVQQGDRVRKGQALFTDRGNEGVSFTAPVGGTVVAINRGERRTLLSVVIEAAAGEEPVFPVPARFDRAQLRDLLLQTGLWTAFRTRPYGKVPAPSTLPQAIFVTAIDTHPLAADPAVVLAEREQAFVRGVESLSLLTEGKVFVIGAPGDRLPAVAGERIERVDFAGPHPAGLPGTHIHFLCPVHEHRTVWHIGCQDVAAIGELCSRGRLCSERVVALGGPGVKRPRLLRTLCGASTVQLTAGELEPGEQRVVSGSVLGGRQARGELAFLGRWHTQVSVLPEGRERRMFGWLSAGANRHSAMRIYLSSLLGARPLSFDTSTNGSPRAIVPIGAYEKVMPLDILATPLLKSLVVGDLETAVALGALELDEEDLALCTYVCPGKYEYGPILRENLARLEKEA
jgi:Na+-transporting NADH:ubiquinone oxidoreductase subunit A